MSIGDLNLQCTFQSGILAEITYFWGTDDIFDDHLPDFLTRGERKLVC